MSGLVPGAKVSEISALPSELLIDEK